MTGLRVNLHSNLYTLLSLASSSSPLDIDFIFFLRCQSARSCPTTLSKLPFTYIYIYVQEIFFSFFLLPEKKKKSEILVDKPSDSVKKSFSSSQFFGLVE